MSNRKEDLIAREKITHEPGIETLAELAREGRRDALTELIRRIQDTIYRLTLRTLFLPADAEDATQEILIKIITHLSEFRRESRFSTWYFRIAANYLLTTRKRRAEKGGYSFQLCEQSIQKALSMSGAEALDTPEKSLLTEEVRLACLQGMLLCLSGEIRLVFILAVVFDVTSHEGVHILAITPQAFRQRLSRGRKQIRNFMTKQCSLFHPENPCTCAKLVPFEIKIKLLDPENLRFANHRCYARCNQSVASCLQELDEVKRLAVLFRSHPDYAAPETFVASIKRLVESGRFELFGG